MTTPPDSGAAATPDDGVPRSRVARLVTYNVVGHAGGLVVALVTSVTLARLLGPSDRGLLAIMLLAATLPVALGSFGLPVATTYFASRPSTPRGAVLGHSLAYALVLTAVFVPAFGLLGDDLSRLVAQGRGDGAWLLVGVLVPITFLSYASLNHLWGRLAMGFGNLLSFASRLVHLLVVVLAVGVVGLGVAGGLLASLAAAAAIVLGAMPVLLRAGRPRVHWPTARAMLRYGALIQVGTLSLLLNFRLDVLVLQHYRPLEAVGHYVVAATVAEIVTVLAVGFQGTLLPLLARQDGVSQGATTRTALVHHGVLAALAVACVAIAGPVLVTVAFGPGFHDALIPMFILLPGMWFLGTASVAAADLQGRDRPGTASLLALVAAIITLVLDVALIPPLGVAGAALASVVAYILFGIASLVVLSRVAGIGVRHLVVPTLDQLRLYPAAVRRLIGRLRPAGITPGPAA